MKAVFFFYWFRSFYVRGVFKVFLHRRLIPKVPLNRQDRHINFQLYINLVSVLNSVSVLKTGHHHTAVSSQASC